MLSVFISALLVMTTLTVCDANWLRHESFKFIPDGREFQSSRPLDPGRKYHVVIESRYTLRPLLICEERTFIGFRISPMCWPNIELNGSSVEVSAGMHDDKWGSYFLDDRTADYYRPQLHLYIWGNGQRLRLNSTRDFTEAVPTATVEIYDIQFRDSEQLLAEQRRKELARIEEQRQQEIIRLAQQRRQEQARLEEERQLELFLKRQREQERAREEQIRQAAQQLRIEQERARITQEALEAEHRRYMEMVWAVFSLALLVVGGLVVMFLVRYFRRGPVRPIQRLSAKPPAMLTVASSARGENARM